MKTKKENKKIIVDDNIMNNDSMRLFTMLSGYLLSVLVIFSVMQILNIINNSIIQILSICIPIIIYLISKNKQSNKKKIITILIYLLITLALPFAYNKTYDTTQDGNSYHKTSIAYLKNGWNPLYESMSKFQKKNKNVIKIEENSRVDLWSEHYPKATWIIAAVIYNMTGNIESGKCITGIITIMFVILLFNCLRKILDKKWSLIIALLFALNPIVLAQIFTYYVDGLMGACFAIELVLLMLINPKEKIDIRVAINLISVACLFVNLKFTGLLCSGVVAAVYYFYWIIKYRKEKEYLSIFKRVTLMFTITFFLAIFLVGSNSYVQNTIQHHNPLYPILGKNKVDIVTTMQPKSFKNKSHIEKFVISVFSKTENTTYEMEPTLKVPIRMYRSELDSLLIPDVRLGGFGPFYAIIFIETIILFISALIILYKKEKESIKYVILPLLTIIISTILVGESWWARYVPQLYFISIGTITMLIYMRKYNKKMLISLIPYILITPIVLNMGCFIYSNYKILKNFKSISSDIIELRKRKNPEIKLVCDNLYGYLYTLKDNNVNYILVEEINDDEKIYMYSWAIEVKKNDKELSKID